MLKLFVCLLIGLFGLHDVHAQTIAVARPDGTVVPYIQQRPRVVRVHDTVQVFVPVRDTLIRENLLREIQYTDTGRVTLNVFVQTQQLPKQAPDTMKERPTQFGVFGYADLHGATVAPTLRINLDAIRLYIYSGVFYTSETKRTNFTVGVAAFAPLF